MSSTAVTWAKDQQIDAGTLGPKVLLLLLADRADENHSCFPGQELLAREAGCDVRSIRRYSEILEEQGFMHKESRQLPQGRGRTSDRYFLHVDQPDNLSARSDDQPTNRTPRDDQPDTGVRYIEPSVEPSVKENVSADADAPSDDVVNLCALLAELVETDVGLRPEITDRWHKDMRLLLERGPSGYKPKPISAGSVQRLIVFVYEHRDVDPKFSWASNMRSPSGVRRNWVKALNWATKYRDQLEREERGEDDDSWMIRSVRAEGQT